MTAGAGGLSIGEALSLVLRRWWIFLLVAAAVAVLVYAAAMRQAPLFQADARLGTSRMTSPIDHPLAGLPAIGGMHPLSTERERLLSRPILEQALVLSGANEREPYRSAREPVQLLRRRMGVDLVRGSHVLELWLRDEDHQRATALLAGVIESYQRSMSGYRSEAASGRLRFLNEQNTEVRADLTLAQEAEHRYRAQHALLGESLEDTPAAQRLRDLTGRQVAAAAAYATSRTLLNHIDAIPEDIFLNQVLELPVLNGHPLVQRQLIERSNRRSAFTEADRRYGPKHPRWQEASQSLADAEAELSRAAALVVAGFRATAAEQLALDTVIGEEIASVSGELLDHRRRLVELERLVRDTERLTALERQLSQQVREEEMASQALVRDLDIIDPPAAVAVPVNIRRKLFLAMAIFLGVSAGWLAAAALDLTDRRFSIERLATVLPGLPVLAELPRSQALRQPGRLHERLPPALRDAFRTLAASTLFAAGRPGQPLAITVTSAGAGDGRATIAGHLAAALALSGKRVLLVDGDLRQPRLHSLFAAQIGPGLAELLHDVGTGDPGVSRPQATAFDSLHLLPAGLAGNREGLIQRSDLAGPFASWKENYDVVLILAPPLGLVPDALAMAEHSDVVLMVVRDRRTPRRAIQTAQRRLAPFTNRLIGVVVNASRTHQDL